MLLRQNWLAAYDFTTKCGAQFLDNYARGADPFAYIGEKMVAVQVTSVVRASDQSFQVKWTETAYERGAEAGTSRWTAILTVAMKSPADAEALRKNPLGLYIDAVDWTRELDPPAPAPAVAGAPLGPALDLTLAAPSRSAHESRP